MIEILRGTEVAPRKSERPTFDCLADKLQEAAQAARVGQRAESLEYIAVALGMVANLADQYTPVVYRDGLRIELAAS